jgi:phosphopentomutase
MAAKRARRRAQALLSPRAVALVVLDSVGVGALPDAEAFGDAGAHTLDHTLQASPVDLPNLSALGLGMVPGVTSLPTSDEPAGAYGRMRERSAGKDTTTGHWEFMGLVLERPFPTFQRFPDEVMAAFDRVTGRQHLGNRPASGTIILDELGAEHLASGAPIVYTSADSVFQVAAHTEVVPVETLYAWCRAAREILSGEHAVARVIARPFTGAPGAFRRLGEHRKDFSLPPTAETVLDALTGAGREVVGLGKIPDIFGHRGFSREITAGSDDENLTLTIEAIAARPEGLVFTNLVEFDALYGHRRDPVGYANALAAFDARLPELRAALAPGDVLMLVSDHGNDPTHPGTDHTREHGLLLVTGSAVQPRPLPTRDSFADVGATVAELLGVPWSGAGTSFARELAQAPT